LAFARKPNVLVNAALVFSLTGENTQANDVMEELRRKFPKDTLIDAVWIPVARATQEIANGQPKRGLELLESSRPYELGQQDAPQSMGRGQDQCTTALSFVGGAIGMDDDVPTKVVTLESGSGYVIELVAAVVACAAMFKLADVT
jgi:hypothetical protein